MTSKPAPFTLHIPDADIADLRERLGRTRFPDQAPGEAWAYGTEVDYLRELIEYWRTTFDWRAEEAALNAFPQFRAALEDVDLHYLHVPGVGPDPMPLLLLHGWPGSVFEFLDHHPAPHRPGALRRRRARRFHGGRAVTARLRPLVPAGPEAVRRSRNGGLRRGADDRRARL